MSPSVRFAPGTAVEYFSATKKDWIQATVVLDRPDGLFDLDCKGAVPVDRLRAVAEHVTTQDHLGIASGASVEYFSESQNRWISAKVISYHAHNDTYDLDCKGGALASRVRAVGHPAGSRGEGASATPSFADLPRPSVGATPSFADLPCARDSIQRASTQCAPIAEVPELKLERMLPPPEMELAPAEGKALQLISVSPSANGWHFEVNSEAAQALERYGNREVTVCAICGPYRT
eukprot:3191760-Amphidinium_carterae.1